MWFIVDVRLGCSRMEAASPARLTSKRDSEGGRYPQYHRPRPYQPNPPNKNITTTMIKSVFVSIVVLSVNFRRVPCDRFRTSSALEKDIAAVLAVHQDRKILYPPPIGRIIGELRQAEHIENWVDLLRRDGRASTPDSDVRKIHVGRVTAPTSPPGALM